MTSIIEINTTTSHHHAAHPIQPSGFMGLARELRDHIYSYMVEPRRSLAELTGHPSDWFNTNILLTNRQIRSEAQNIIYEQMITVVIKPFEESNLIGSSTRVVEWLKFKRCGIEVDLSGWNDKKHMWANSSIFRHALKQVMMWDSVFHPLVLRLNRMSGLEEMHIWSPRRTIPTDEGLEEQKEDSGVDEESEMDMDDEAVRYKDLGVDEALSLEKLRQRDDAIFLEVAISYFRPLADTINVTIEGNLSSEDSKRILSLVDGDPRSWPQGMTQGLKTRVFAVDKTPASCESGGTRLISKVIALRTVCVSLDGHAQMEIMDKESVAAIQEFRDLGF